MSVGALTDFLVIICSPTLKGSTYSFAIKDPTEVGCTFVLDDVGAGLNPYSHHYNATFAFSVLLYLHNHQLVLQLASLFRGGTGLPCSTYETQ